MSAVDVVVPCYNYGRFLNGCVDSALAQRNVDVRVLIVDDASSDNTSVVGERLASDDTRVTFRRHKLNQGLIKTANEGILDWARAPYTLLLSADDILTPGSLARATQVLNLHPEAGMVYGMAKVIGDGEQPVGASDVATPTYRILSRLQFLKRCYEHGNPASSPTAVVRTQLQQSTGGYSEKMPQTSDLEMWMRVATHSSIAVIKDVQAYYRVHDNNMTKQYYTSELIMLRENVATCEYVSAKWGHDRISEFDLLTRWMKRSVAKSAVKLANRALENNDLQEYRKCLAFAEQMDPFWKVSTASGRLRVRRLLGATLWRRLRHLFMQLGYVPAADENEWVDNTYGWWPADR
jgi:glycosyltransferase involved in cell wall biosynthesis